MTSFKIHDIILISKAYLEVNDMQEVILQNKKHGMRTLLLYVAIEILAIAGIVIAAILDEGNKTPNQVWIPIAVLSVLVMCVAWIPLCGLRVLKPNEALVLTLFGKYVGTIKGEGFYALNPFCVAVNPAAQTKLNQSGDVAKASTSVLTDNDLRASTTATIVDKKISLKIMTLNNNRQKVNDCLGNPVEIGIAVMWKVVDTAKAVFNVDNYKEYLSLQCDSALRNIVRIYPYDVATGIDTTGDGLEDDGS